VLLNIPSWPSTSTRSRGCAVFKGSAVTSASGGARSRLFFFQNDEIRCLRFTTGELGAEDDDSSGTGVAGVTGLEGLLKRLWPEIEPKLT